MLRRLCWMFEGVRVDTLKRATDSTELARNPDGHYV